MTRILFTFVFGLVTTHYASCQDKKPNILSLGLDALYKSKDYDNAIKIFSDLMKEDSIHKSFYYSCRGQAYHKKGEFDKAIEDLTAAIRINPQLYLSYVARGDVFYSKQIYKSALIDYDAAIRLNPKRSVSYFNRGLIKNALGQYNGAIDDYTKAIKQQPKYVDAYVARGSAYYALGSRRNAISDYSTALEYAPRHYGALQNRGLIYRNSGSYRLAIEDFSRLIKYEPDNPNGYYILASELASCPQNNIRDGKRAVEVAKMGCELSKWKIPSYYVVLAIAYAESGDFDLAIEWESKALADPAFDKKFGEGSRARLALYNSHRPYRYKRHRDDKKMEEKKKG